MTLEEYNALLSQEEDKNVMTLEDYNNMISAEEEAENLKVAEDDSIQEPNYISLEQYEAELAEEELT